MKKIKISILTFLLTLVMFVCFGCNTGSQYTLNTDRFEAIVEYNGDIDVTSIVLYDNETQSEISSEDFVIVRCDDTNTIGEKELVIRYKDTEFTIPFTVKYKVEFKVSGEVIDTQYVDNANQIIMPENPSRVGYEFINWDNRIPTQLNDNLIFNAIFSSTTLEVPELSNITADYSTKLKDIKLPSNNNGSWVFVNDGETEVGNVGVNTFEVKFVPTTSELTQKFDQVTINVNQKKLDFVIDNETFVYDGNAHFPQYSLPVDVDVEVIGSEQTLARKNPYEYGFIINDDNYYGYYYGEFTITKAQVTLTVEDKIVDYAESFEMGYSVQGFDNLDILGINIEKPAILNVGEYQIGATINNPNVDLTVVKGTLTVNPIDLDPAPVDPVISTVSKAAVFSDKISTITFENNFANGVWDWKNPNTVIDKINGFKAIAVFTPKSSNYKTIEREISIENILKKTLNINVLNNAFVYDGNLHTINYQIENGSYEQVEVLGNIVKQNAGQYSTTLVINSEFYQGSTNVTLIINKATPKTDFTNTYSATWFAGISLSDIALNPGYAWKNSSTSLDQIGTKLFEAEFIPEDTDNYNSVNGQFEVTINKSNASISNVKDIYNYVYTGNAYNIAGIMPSHYESNLQYTYIYNDEIISSLTNAGEYKVSITLPESTHYNQATAETKVVIEKATVDVMLQTLTAVYENTLADVVLPKDNTGVWTWKQDLSTSVGNAGLQTHTAIFTPNNNNYEVAEFEAKIQVSKKQLQFEIVENTYTYDKLSHSVQYSVVDNSQKQYNNLIVSGNMEVVNAGVYNLTLSVEDENYEATKTTQLIINQASLVPTIPQDLSATYLDAVCSIQLPQDEEGVWVWNVYENVLVGDVGNKTFKATFIYNELENCDNYIDYVTQLNINVVKKSVKLPTLDVASKVYTGNTIKADINDTVLYTVTNNGWTDVGNYKIELALTDSNNYVWGNGEIEIAYIDFAITKAQAVISNFNITGWTYGEDANTPSASTNFGTIKYSYSTEEDGTYSESVPTNAGTYYVKAEVESTDNYNGDSQVIPMSIAKASVTIPTIESKVYTGSNLIADVQESKLYVIDSNNGGIEKGKYNVILKLTDFVNYKWVGSDEQTITLQFEITSALNIWTTEPSIKGWTYGETEEEAVAESKFGEVIVEYKQKQADDTTYTTTKPNNAGEYIARFSVDGTISYNALTTTIPFTIVKDTVELPNIESKVYTGELLMADVEDSTLYTVVSNEGGIEKGKYDVVLKLNDFVNYKWVDSEEQNITLTFEITSALNIWTTEPSITGWTYGEAEVEAIADSKFGEVIVEYKQKQADDTTYTTTKPSNAGEYIARFSVAGTDDYNALTKIQAFTISKATIEVPSIESKVYTGSELQADVETSDLYEITTNTKATNVGGYPVVLTITNSNYKWANGSEDTVGLTFNITKAQAEIKDLNLIGWTYGESANTPSATTNFGTIEYTYSTSENGTYSQDLPTNAGTYYVKAEVDSTSNYDGDSEVLEFVIEKAQAEIKDLNLIGWTYGEDVNSPSATTNFGTIEYTYSTSENGTYSQDLPTNAGTYYIKAEVDSTSNYDGDSEVLEFVIKKATVEVPSIESKVYTGSELQANIAKSSLYEITTNTKATNVGGYPVVLTITNSNYKWANDGEDVLNLTFNITKAQAEIKDLNLIGWTYGESANTPSATTNFGTIEYTYSTSENGTYSEIVPTNAGTYYVKAEVDSTSNYDGDSEVLEFVIEKATIEVPSIESKVYTGSELQADIETSDLYEITTNTKATNVGRYPVVLTITNSNYKWANGSEDTVGLTFNITKAQAIVSNLGIVGWTYGESANSPSATTNFGTIEYAYSTSENGTYSQDLPTNAGTYYVKAEVDSTSNYDGDSAIKSFAIAKAQAEITGFDIKGWTYSQTASVPTITTSSFITSSDIKYYYKGTGDWDTQIVTNAGNYKAKAVIAETNNFYGCESAEVGFTIAKATPTITKPTYNAIYLNVDDIKSSYATAPVAKNLSGGSVVGTWNYKNIAYNVGDNASSFTLEFNPTDSNNYNIASASVNFTTKSVAHIGTTYYLSIENALNSAVSGDLVFVSADTTGKVKITSNCTIANGVTLVLPHGSADTDRTSEGNATLSGSNNGDVSQLQCANKVVLSQGVTLTIASGGILEISGILSGANGGSGYAGHTCTKYAELVMETNSKIYSDGEIKLTGFINESALNNGSQITINSGSVSLPFVLRDFRGGSYMSAAVGGLFGNGKEVASFNQYQFRNISSKLRINYNGNLVGYANLYANRKNNHDNINFVGADNSFMIQFASNGYLEAKYNPSTEVCDLDIYGGMTLNSLSIKVAGTTIKTSSVYFPLNWCFDISLNKLDGQTSATYTLTQKLKMLPGSKLTIGAGAVATFSNLNIYDNTYTDTTTVSEVTKYPTYKVLNGKKTTEKIESAKLIVNGTLICDKIGGNIYSYANNATITIKSAIGMTTNETHENVSGSSFWASVKFKEVKFNYDANGQFHVYLYGINNNSEVIDTFDVTATGTYTYNGSKWSKTA